MLSSGFWVGFLEDVENEGNQVFISIALSDAAPAGSAPGWMKTPAIREAERGRLQEGSNSLND
jgi:hypothetical protein